MKRIFLSVLISTTLFSCTSSDDAQIPETQNENFYALTIGNSWVYKNYKFNFQTSQYDYTGVIDSISIINTQEIDGNTYYNFRRLTTGNEANITFCNPNGEHFELLRDSLGYLITSEGSIKFTNNDIAERVLLEKDWGTIYEKLVSGFTTIDVESGTFICINSERYARNLEGEQLPGLDRFYYSDGIGLIYDTSSFVSSATASIIRRLDSYSIQ